MPEISWPQALVLTVGIIAAAPIVWVVVASICGFEITFWKK
jgi:hypothetical protein